MPPIGDVWYCTLTLGALWDHLGEVVGPWVRLTISRKRGFCMLGINPWQMVEVGGGSVSRENTGNRMLELSTKRSTRAHS